VCVKVFFISKCKTIEGDELVAIFGVIRKSKFRKFSFTYADVFVIVKCSFIKQPYLLKWIDDNHVRKGRGHLCKRYLAMFVFRQKSIELMKAIVVFCQA